MYSAFYRTVVVCLILVAMFIASYSEAQNQQTSTSLVNKSEKFNTFYNYIARDFNGTLDSNYIYQPESLRVTTQNFGFGYKINDHYHLGLSGKYLKNEIELTTDVSIPGMPSRIDASTEGMGDSQIGVTREWIFAPQNYLLASLNLSIPTGDYEQKTSSGKLVSYQGQLGSGTYDINPTLHYSKRINSLEYTARLNAYLRTGRNDLNYRLGDEVMGLISSAYWLNKYLAITGSLYYKNWREVVGSENVVAFNNKISASRHIPSSGSASMSASPHGHYGSKDQQPSANPHSKKIESQPHHFNPFAFNPFANKETGDIFAASGARWSAMVGLKSGIYLGPIFKAVIEAGIPVYDEQIGPLKGLEPNWFAMTALQSSF